MAVPIRYASFLIRIWREGATGEGSSTAGWHAEVEHIQSNQCWTFGTVEELLASLRRQAEDIPGDEDPAGDDPSFSYPVIQCIIEVPDNKNPNTNNNIGATNIP